jgi:hypothetical protein
MTFADKLKELRGAVENPASNPIARFRNLQTLDAFLANHAAEIEALVRAAKCIRHWHDSSNDGMIVSAEHVRNLWDALAALEDK